MNILRRLAAFAFVLMLCAAAHAQPVVGRDYAVLDPPRPTAAAGTIEVIEFFYYGCPVCYEAEPKITAWQSRAGADIRLVRIPAVAREGWEKFGRSFFALEAMGEIERLHWAVYDNFHFDGRDLKDEATFMDWVGRNGVDRSRFEEIWGSAAITEKLRVARNMIDDYQIQGVPTLVIDGRYVTSARMAGDTSKMMTVVEALVAKVRQERR